MAGGCLAVAEGHRQGLRGSTRHVIGDFCHPVRQQHSQGQFPTGTSHVVIALHCPAVDRCLGARKLVQTSDRIIQKHPGAQEMFPIQLIAEVKVAEK